jgi:O-antigen/teichoic acid export membrane protein
MATEQPEGDPHVDDPGSGAHGQAGAAATRRVARNTVALVAADAAAKLSLFVLYALIARSLGTGGFGDYTLAASLAFFIRLSALGTDLILSREVSRELGNVHGLFWDTIVLKLGAGVPVLAGILAFTVASGYPEATVVATGLIGVSNLLDVLGLSFHSVLRGRERMGASSIALALENVLIVCLGAVALLVFDAGLVGLGVAYLAAAIVALAFIWIGVLRQGIRPRRVGDTGGLRWLLRTAAPTGFAAFFGIALARVDAVILAELTDDSQTVGLYGGAYRLYDATLFVSWAFGLAIYPTLSRLGRQTASLRRVFEVSCMAIAAVTVPLGAMMALYGPALIEAVFGPGFGDGGTATRILGGAAALYGVFSVAALTIAGQDKQKLFPLIGGAALAVNLVLNFALIPPLSLDGAAVAMTGSQLVAVTVAMWFGIREAGGFSVLRVFAAVLAGVVAMVIPALALGSGGPAMVLSLLLFAAVFLATEYWLHRDELLLFLRAITQRRGTSQSAGDRVG